VEQAKINQLSHKKPEKFRLWLTKWQPLKH